jgi:hypothetical protein
MLWENEMRTACLHSRVNRQGRNKCRKVLRGECVDADLAVKVEGWVMESVEVDSIGEGHSP